MGPIRHMSWEQRQMYAGMKGILERLSPDTDKDGLRAPDEHSKIWLGGQESG